MLAPVTLLHLSDIHFGRATFQHLEHGKAVTRHESVHAFVKDGQPDPQWLATTILRDTAIRQPPTAIIVSGDIGWSGSFEDYKYAELFIAALRAKWKGIAIVLCPGNHDFSWDLGTAGKNPQTEYFRFAKRVYGPNFDVMLCSSDTADSFEQRRLASIHRITGDNHDLLVVTANSASELSHTEADAKAGKGYACVHPRTLLDLEERIQQHLSEPQMRVFVMHHHLLPFYDLSWKDRYDGSAPPSPADRTMISNSGQLQDWLARNKFDIVLHGHKHVSHTRRDVLQSGRDGVERDIVVVGAGSAGVYRKELLQTMGHEYNLLTLRAGARRKWRVRVDTRRVSGDIRRPANGQAFEREVGAINGHLPSVFSRPDWESCHEVIRYACWGPSGPQKNAAPPTIANFISVVDAVPDLEDCDWTPPPTCQMGGSFVARDVVERAFRVLHPEYEKSDGWRHSRDLRVALEQLPERFHFRHGPRLFWPKPGDSDCQNSPIHTALRRLGGSVSRSYAATYNASLDAHRADAEPIPALMGVQFVRDSGYVDVVATFRNLELSFWWVVNFVEMARLLRFAAEHAPGGLKPRRITFMAPIAEWLWDPQPPVIPELDRLDLVGLAMVALESPPNDRLVALLSEKLKHLSAFNLDEASLEATAHLVEARTGNADIASEIRAASAKIVEARNDESARHSHLRKARNLLAGAISKLSSAATAP
jgi:hypothetical protein